MLISDATNLPRLMACNGSRLMQPDPIYAESDNTIREEGNAVHWLASEVFNTRTTVDEMVDRKAPNGVYITPEMAEHVADYLENTRNRQNVGVVGHMEWSHFIAGTNWQVNGRADHICYDSMTSALYVDDFKYGYSIVEPHRNWTLIAHAIGYCVDKNVAPQQITFTVHQPRAPHYDGRTRSWTISYNELVELWREIDRVLSNPNDVLQTGKQCYKCHAFTSCPARQAAEMNSIEAAHTAFRAEIDNRSLADRLDMISRATEMLKQAAKAYEELAVYRLKSGQILDGYSIEVDLTNRMWKEGVTPELMFAMTGKDLTKPQLITPRQAELKKIPTEIVAAMSERKPKGAKLVKMSADKKARKLFGDRK